MRGNLEQAGRLIAAMVRRERARRAGRGMRIFALVLGGTVAVIVALLGLALVRGRRARREAERARTRTPYVDAWAEAGRRAPTPPPGSTDGRHPVPGDE